MDKPKLYTPRERTREEIEQLLVNADSMVVYRALLDAASYEDDWQWVQQKCIDLLHNGRDKTVRCGAIFGLQFLCEVRHLINAPKAIAALIAARLDPDLTWNADDALNDLYHRFPEHRPRPQV